MSAKSRCHVCKHPWGVRRFNQKRQRKPGCSHACHTPRAAELRADEYEVLARVWKDEENLIT